MYSEARDTVLKLRVNKYVTTYESVCFT